MTEAQTAPCPAGVPPKGGRLALQLGTVGWTVAFDDCPKAATGLRRILHGWRLLDVDGWAHPCDAVIGRKGGKFTWWSDTRPKPSLWDRVPPSSAMSVIGDLHDVFIDWYLDDHPELLCLHAAAVDIGADGLVCFPSVGKAGKSTLCADLVANGARLVCDDVLPVDPLTGRALALGFAPLLRRPLPSGAGPGLRAFVSGRMGPSNSDWQYLKLDDHEIHPLGHQAPIRGLVLLDRRPDVANAAFIPVSEGEMMTELILQNFARRVVPSVVLSGLGDLVRRSECLRLTYSSSADAGGLIRRRWARP